jgi:hypothetical protein
MSTTSALVQQGAPGGFSPAYLSAHHSSLGRSFMFSPCPELFGIHLSSWYSPPLSPGPRWPQSSTHCSSYLDVLLCPWTPLVTVPNHPASTHTSFLGSHHVSAYALCLAELGSHPLTVIAHEEVLIQAGHHSCPELHSVQGMQ